MTEYFYGKNVEVDKQHRAICCAACHAMLNTFDTLIPTKHGDYRCLDCVDRADSDGNPMTAWDMRRLFFAEGDYDG